MAEVLHTLGDAWSQHLGRCTEKNEERMAEWRAMSPEERVALLATLPKDEEGPTAS